MKVNINITPNELKHYPIPQYISDNLAFTLRGYQSEAVKKLMYYLNEEDIYNTKNEWIKKERDILFQMATGSGKTLLMAAVILLMYKRGYRNFWYFVTSTDLITKTVDNFCNSASSKSQFKANITIDNIAVRVNRVENFAQSDGDAINIKFSTVNALHSILQKDLIGENDVTLEDFNDKPCVLLGDESHHFNASTKDLKNDNVTWEDSINAILNSNKENYLFEFTATANFDNPNIADKYKYRLLHNYDLKDFCEDGYSKDIFTFSTDSDIDAVIIRALLISEYRAHIASDNGVYLKPVILFKSKTTAESKENFNKFNKMIENLSALDIKKQFSKREGADDSKIWSDVCKYFEGREEQIAQKIALDFDVSTRAVLLHDGTNTRDPDQPRLLTTLEESDNSVRAIFAVNMLNEGWDVLNLFDIVRLYDTRDGKQQKDGTYTPGKTTTSEVQLIGRGARYYPFSYGDADKYKRKFDNDEDNPMRVMEEMHYHCKHNPQYIKELKSALTKEGVPIDSKIYVMEMTDRCKKEGSEFSKKLVFENERVNKADIRKLEPQRPLTTAFDFSDRSVKVKVAIGDTKEMCIFKDGKIKSGEKAGADELSCKYALGAMGELDDSIIRRAINSNKHFTFESIQKAYPDTKSVKEFMDTLKKVQIISNVREDEKNREVLLHLIEEVLFTVQRDLIKESNATYGTKDFYAHKTMSRFAKKIIRKKVKDSKQNEFDFGDKDWCVYKNGLYTDDEKSFLDWFNDLMKTRSDGFNDLTKKGWSEVYLARNEKAVKIYNEGGRGFEPDFVLLAKKEEIDYAFYIEVKGNWAKNYETGGFDKEEWKEEFLLSLEKVNKSAQKDKDSGRLLCIECKENNFIKVECEKWRLEGLPFYNKDEKEKFTREFKQKLKLEGEDKKKEQ